MSCFRVGPVMMAAVAVLSAVPDRAAAVPAPAADSTYSFVVVGHVRRDRTGGILHPRLGELIERIRRLDPDLVFLTGDMVWGDVDSNPANVAEVEREWQVLDSALATLATPVHRVPGNHDISDLGTRDLYFRRYGRLPQVLEFRGSRFVLLSSAWIPPDGDTRHNPFIRPAALDSAQVEFLRSTLGPPGRFAHTFVFQHHMLWWEPDAAWWREVHPLLTQAGVDAVFAGDYGPLKFSFTEKDGLRYYQSSIEGDVKLGIVRQLMSSRLLEQQFDNFLQVTVRGSRVDVEVRTVGETSSGKFTPEHWREVNLWEAPPPPLATRLWKVVGSPKRIAALVLLAAGLFAAGWLGGRRWGRRRGPVS
jgi:3',5'-cyclic AMP phosphodiesterase CpdA